MTARFVHVEFQLKCLGRRETLFEIVINFEFGITQMGKYLQMGVHKTRKIFADDEDLGDKHWLFVDFSLQRLD